MTADTLLSRLERVKRTGAGRWNARCPAHDDRGPSLSVRELEDGRILVHCFAGCDVGQVLGALAMEVSDLYPARTPIGDGGHRSRPERRPFPAPDILRCVAFEALVVAAAAASLMAGHPIGLLDRERLMIAVERLQAAASMQEVARWKR